MNIDFKTGIDVMVLAITAFGAWQNMKVKMQIERLKWWMVRNFQAKPGANFMDDGDPE